MPAKLFSGRLGTAVETPREVRQLISAELLGESGFDIDESRKLKEYN
jgi:hypothetical protein